MTRSRALLSCLFCVIASAVISRAQAPVLHIDSKAMPTRIVVPKGTLVELSGELSQKEEALPTTFTIRCGGQVRATGSFLKKWSLTLDPSKEPTSTSYMMLFRTETGSVEMRVARFEVDVLDANPFKISSPADRSTTEGPLSIKVVKTGPLKMTGGDILIDGKPIGKKIDESGSLELNLLGQKPGTRLLSVKVALDGGGDIETEPIHVLLTSKIKVFRNEVGPLDLRSATPQVPIRTAYPAELKAKTAFFYLDDSPFAKSDTPPFEDVTLNGEGLASGNHTLRAEIVCEDGQRYVSPDLDLQVIGNVKNEFVAWRNRVQNQISAGEQVREQFQDISRRLGREMTIGDVNESLKKLRASDQGLTHSLEKIAPPSSMEQSDRDTLMSALRMYQSAYEILVKAESEGLSSIASDAGYREWWTGAWRGNLNTALLKVADANQRVNGVANRIGVGDGAGEGPGFDLTYRVTGKPTDDFASWAQQLDRLVADSNAIGAHDLGSASPENVLLLDKAIRYDTKIAASIQRLRPPASLAENLRERLTIALQNVSGAYDARVAGEKVLRSRIKGQLDGLDRQGMLLDRSSAAENQQRMLYNKEQLMISSAREKIKEVARALGIE